MVRLLQDAEKQIIQRNARTLTPQHIKQAINSHQCMGFLQGLVADIPDNFQSSIQDGDDSSVSSRDHASSRDFEEPKPKKRRKPNRDDKPIKKEIKEEIVSTPYST